MQEESMRHPQEEEAVVVEEEEMEEAEVEIIAEVVEVADTEGDILEIAVIVINNHYNRVPYMVTMVMKYRYILHINLVPLYGLTFLVLSKKDLEMSEMTIEMYAR
jgi:hypothetical protein